MYWAARLEPCVGALRHQAAVTQFMGQVEEDAGEVGFVFDHQDAAVAERRALTVVVKRRQRAFWRCRHRHLRGRRQGVDRRAQAEGLHAVPHAFVVLWQDQAEHTAFARAAVNADLPAQQMRQVARDRKPQAGATVTAVAGTVDLMEGTENGLLLVGGNADASIAHSEDNASASLVTDVQAHLATLGELDGIGQQVLEDLLQALAVGEQGGGYIRFSVYFEGQPLVPGQRFEHAAQALDQAFHLSAFRAHLELAGLDLGNVENVVDQVEQVIAGRVDRICELDLFIAQVAFGVFRQQFGQDQRAVQRRAQLVGHIGQELGLVLARALQLVGARLQLVLSLHQLVVLQVQRLCAFGQLLVGLLQAPPAGFQGGPETP